MSVLDNRSQNCCFLKWTDFVDIVCIASFDQYSGVNVYVP